MKRVLENNRRSEGSRKGCCKLIRERVLFQSAVDPRPMLSLPMQPYNVIVHAWFRNSISMILIQLTPCGNLYYSESRLYKRENTLTLRINVKQYDQSKQVLRGPEMNNKCLLSVNNFFLDH